MSEIYKNEGGFRLITAGVPKPTIKLRNNLVFYLNLNLPAKDKPSHYAVDVYYDDRFVMRTNELPIVIHNQELLNLFESYTLMKFTFITQRIIGNKQSSEPLTITIRKTLCSDRIKCSNNLICCDGVLKIVEGVDNV